MSLLDITLDTVDCVAFAKTGDVGVNLVVLRNILVAVGASEDLQIMQRGMLCEITRCHTLMGDLRVALGTHDAHRAKPQFLETLNKTWKGCR